MNMMQKKRFWVFGYDRYYPAGGMKDFQGDFNTYEEAIASVRSDYNWDYIDVYDALNDKIVHYKTPNW